MVHFEVPCDFMMERKVAAHLMSNHRAGSDNQGKTRLFLQRGSCVRKWQLLRALVSCCNGHSSESGKKASCCGVFSWSVIAVYWPSAVNDTCARSNIALRIYMRTCV